MVTFESKLDAWITREPEYEEEFCGCGNPSTHTHTETGGCCGGVMCCSDSNK